MDILGFSIGGYIAWKAALEGLKVRNLTAVSATRLRFETTKPDCKIALIYGEHDTFQPSIDWYNRIELDKIIYVFDLIFLNRFQSFQVYKHVILSQNELYLHQLLMH